jgi:hypothetical protein
MEFMTKVIVVLFTYEVTQFIHPHFQIIYSVGEQLFCFKKKLLSNVDFLNSHYINQTPTLELLYVVDTRNIIKLIDCVLWDHVSGENSYNLIPIFPMYAEH